MSARVMNRLWLVCALAVIGGAVTEAALALAGQKIDTALWVLWMFIVILWAGTASIWRSAYLAAIKRVKDRP